MRNSEKLVELSIIIVNWNTKTLLYECLKSIYEKVSGFIYEVTVVDNASTDGSIKMVRQNFPQVKLIENKENLGFAKANNQAIKLIKNCTYVLLLNSDVVIKNEIIQKLMEFLEKNPNAGVVGPALRMPDGKLQKGGVAGYFPSLLTGFNYFFFLSILFSNVFKGIYINQSPYVKKKKVTEVDWIAGTCLMTRLEIIKKVGKLDESIFMYTEEIEWCKRVKNKGWKNFYLPHAEVTHHLWGSQKGISGKGIKALLQYVLYNHGIAISVIFRLITFLGLWIRFIIYSLYFIFSGNQKYRNKSRQMYIFALNALKRKFN